MLGENFVKLKGYVIGKTFKHVGANNIAMFKGSLEIPTENGKRQFVKIAAWGSIAEDLSSFNEKTFVKIHGHIEDSSYDSNCSGCNMPMRKYWTEVIIDNFIEEDENE
jgi:hypothetical protein